MPGDRLTGARARRTTASLLAAAFTAGALAAPSGAAPPSPGGMEADTSPIVTAVACSRACTAGSTVVLRGSNLADVVAVGFARSARSRSGDVLAQPSEARERRVLVVVPDTARRGPVVAYNAAGEDSEPSEPVDIVTPKTPKARGGAPIATAVTTRKAYFDGARRPTLAYELTTRDAAAVSVQVVREADRAVVKTFEQGTVAPGERHTLTWNGKVRGKPARDGRYAFVVVAEDESSGVLATSASSGGSSPDAFTLLGHRFPVRGKHGYGEEVAGFGGARGHQGHDVFAACGTPLVAARGGVVKMKRWQHRAGNYLVIDGAGTDVDYAYMHLRDPALVEQRERVRTGQPIGYVGDTGRASGCHLHFEEWSGPGWYTGGSPFDPLPDLLAWDRVS